MRVTPLPQSPAQTGTQYGDTPDTLLLSYILQRKREALGALYDRHGSLVYSVALRLTHDQATAEIIVLAVFGTIWQTAAAYIADQSVAAWVLSITRHHTLLQMRTQKRPAQCLYNLHAALPRHQLSGDWPVNATSHAAVQQALEGLTVAERTTIEQAYYLRLPATQIAALFDEPVARVKECLRNGLGKLREQLRDI